MFVKDIRKEFYDLLLKQRVLIMVNYDVDAVCALKLITTLFKYDKILFTIIPVTEQSDMEKAFQTYRNSVKYFLLINVGAVIDITEILDPDEDQIIFIADNHRPLDVYNVYRVENVRLLMDEKDTDEVPDFNDLFREDDEEDTGGRSLEELERRDERRKWEERRKEILLEFAEYTYYGESVSYIFFKLAWKMSLDSNELLWLAIIGIFDLYVNDRILKKTFDDYVSQLKNHLKRLANSKSTVNLFDQANASIDDILNVPAGRRAFVSITHKKDLKITLYRHWNLYDSLQHTKLVSCRFKVWQRTGRCRFKEFLADLGIPLRQSKQKFASMDFELRKNVLDWIENLSEKYNLQGIIADSFEANHGFRHKFAAADIVYSLNALLESPSKELSPKEKFMKTLDALSWSNVDYLLEGIEQSKQQLTAILNQVHDLIELRSIQSRGPYLFAQISRSHPEARIFCNPGCLHSLARFLLPAFVASQKKKSLKSLPLVVAVEEVDDPDASLAVGIPPVAGDPTRNLFSRLFVQTASELRIEVLPVLYDYNIIKVRSEHLGDILERLVTSFSG